MSRFRKFLSRTVPEFDVQVPGHGQLTVPERSMSWRDSMVHYYPLVYYRYLWLTSHHHPCGCWTRFVSDKRDPLCQEHLLEVFKAKSPAFKAMIEEKQRAEQEFPQATFGEPDE